MKGMTVSEEQFKKFQKWEEAKVRSQEGKDDCKPLFTLTIKSRCKVCDYITTLKTPAQRHQVCATVHSHLGCGECDKRLEEMSKEHLIKKVKDLVPYLKEFKKNMAKKGE